MQYSRPIDPSPISLLISAHCSTIKRKHKRFDHTEFAAILNDFVRELKSDRFRPNIYLNLLHEIAQTLNHYSPSILSSFASHPFFSLIRNATQYLLQQFNTQSDLNDHDGYMLRNFVLLIEHAIQRATDLSATLYWITDSIFLQVLSSSFYQIKKQRKNPRNQHIIKQMIRLLNTFSYLQEQLPPHLQQNLFQPLFQPTMDCLTSSTYIKLFRSLPSDSGCLTNQEKFFLLKCPRFLTTYNGSLVENGFEQILETMIPRYVKILDQHMKHIDTWTRSTMRAIHNLLITVICAEDYFSFYTNDQAFRLFVAQLIQLINQPKLNQKIHTDSNNLPLLLIDTTLILLTIFINEIDILDYIKQQKPIQIFHQLTLASRETIVLNAHMMLAYTIDENDIETTSIDHAQVLRTILDLFQVNIKKLGQSQKDNRFDHEETTRNVNQLLDILKALVQYEQVRNEFLRLKALPTLINTYQMLSDLSKAHLLECLWSLAFNKAIAEEFRNQASFIGLLQKLSSDFNRSTSEKQIHRNANSLISNGSSILRIIDGLLWTLKKEAYHIQNSKANKKNRSKKNKTKTLYDVMICHSHLDRDIVQKIRDYLADHDFRVCCNDYRTYDKAMESLTKDVEMSTNILVCISDSLKRDNFCQAMVDHALNCKRVLLPIIIRKGSKLDGWLKQLNTSNFCINFATSTSKTALRLLVKRINDLHENHEPTISTNPSIPTSTSGEITSSSVMTSAAVQIELSDISGSMSTMAREKNQEHTLADVSSISKSITPSKHTSASAGIPHENPMAVDQFEPKLDTIIQNSTDVSFGYDGELSSILDQSLSRAPVKKHDASDMADSDEISDPLGSLNSSSSDVKTSDLLTTSEPVKLDSITNVDTNDSTYSGKVHSSISAMIDLAFDPIVDQSTEILSNHIEHTDTSENLDPSNCDVEVSPSGTTSTSMSAENTDTIDDDQQMVRTTAAVNVQSISNQNASGEVQKRTSNIIREFQSRIPIAISQYKPAPPIVTASNQTLPTMITMQSETAGMHHRSNVPPRIVLAGVQQSQQIVPPSKIPRMTSIPSSISKQRPQQHQITIIQVNESEPARVPTGRMERPIFNNDGLMTAHTSISDQQFILTRPPNLVQSQQMPHQPIANIPISMQPVQVNQMTTKPQIKFEQHLQLISQPSPAASSDGNSSTDSCTTDGSDSSDESVKEYTKAPVPNGNVAKCFISPAVPKLADSTTFQGLINNVTHSPSARKFIGPLAPPKPPISNPGIKLPLFPKPPQLIETKIISNLGAPCISPVMANYDSTSKQDIKSNSTIQTPVRPVVSGSTAFVSFKNSNRSNNSTPIVTVSSAIAPIQIDPLHCGEPIITNHSQTTSMVVHSMDNGSDVSKQKQNASEEHSSTYTIPRENGTNQTTDLSSNTVPRVSAFTADKVENVSASISNQTFSDSSSNKYKSPIVSRRESLDGQVVFENGSAYVGSAVDTLINDKKNGNQLPDIFLKRNTNNSKYRTLSINAWSNKDVLDFLFDSKLYSLMPICEQMSGQAFLRLFQLCEENPSQLYGQIDAELSAHFNGLSLPISVYTEYLNRMTELLNTPTISLSQPSNSQPKIIQRVILKQRSLPHTSQSINTENAALMNRKPIIEQAVFKSDLNIDSIDRVTIESLDESSD